MVFKTSLAQDKKSIKQNVFEFQVSGSTKTFSLPLRQYLNAALADRLAQAAAPLQPYLKAHAAGTLDEDSSPDAALLVEMQRVQRDLFDTYAPGAYEAATQSEISEVMQAWGAASNVDLGEFSASPSS